MEERVYRSKSLTDRFQSHDYSTDHADAFARRYDEGERLVKAGVVRRYLGSCRDKDVVDLGCGVGYFSALSADLGARSIASDFSEAMVQKVRARYGEKFPVVRASAESPPFRDNCADTVLVLDVIEHLYEPERLLANASRLLRTGGTLIITTDVRGFTIGSVYIHARRLRRRLSLALKRRLSTFTFRGRVPATSRALSAFLDRRYLSHPHATPLCTHVYEYRVPELIGMVTNAGFQLADYDTFPNRRSYGIGGAVLEVVGRGPLKRYKWPHAAYVFRKPLTHPDRAQPLDAPPLAT